MKKTFRGETHWKVPYSWDERTVENPWLNSSVLHSAEYSNIQHRLICHPSYCCVEYKQAINIFSFGRIKFSIPFYVIAPPISVDECGFVGDIEALIADYRNRKGLFLMLNLSNKSKLPRDVAFGRTLSTAIFYNKFKTYDEFIRGIRSSYRRRINLAKLKAGCLIWREIDNDSFDEKIHSLYLNVLHKSKYPLETLGVDFFRNITGQIHVLYEENEPLAFVLIKWQGDELHFLFGGMDYTKRDQYDLYYNMLLKILEIGIDNGARKIDFGQTAESSKCRIGCQLEDRYMVFFSGNRVINRLVKIFAKFLEYSPPEMKYNVFLP